jgi:hypothetical protein
MCVKALHVRFRIKPARHTCLIGDDDRKVTRIVALPDGCDGARHPCELIRAMGVAAVAIEGAIAIEQDRAAAHELR